MSKIYLSHQRLSRDNLIPLYDPYLHERLEVFNRILDGNVSTAFKYIILMNSISKDNNENLLKIKTEM